MYGVFKVLWTITAFFTATLTCKITEASVLTTLTTAFGVLFVVSAAFKWYMTNLAGAIFNALLGWAAFQAGFYGNAMVSWLFIVPVSLYGVWLWVHNTEEFIDNKSLPRDLLPLLTGCFVVLVAASFGFSYTSGANLPVLDAVTTALPIMATLMLSYGYKAHWYFWIVFNVIAVYMWFSAASLNPEAISLFVMKIVFLVNSLIGYYEWNKCTDTK